MYTLIGSFDYTAYIDYNSISITQSINDPLPKASFDLYDEGSQILLSIGQEIIIHDENALPEFGVGGGVIAAVPAHNILRNANDFRDTTIWTTGGPNASLLSLVGVADYQMIFSNAGAGQGYVQQISLQGYVQPGQSYMFSVYVTGTAPVNIQYFLQITWLDAGSNVISSISQIAGPPTSETRETLSGVAPANAVFAQVQFGGQPTVAGSNSGTILFGTPQFEPMWFVAEGVSYPTPDCNFNQPDCAYMPDNTTSRSSRLFAGFIDDLQVAYDGPNRVYTVSCAGGAAHFENGLVNGTYASYYDDEIITSVISTYFPSQITLGSANAVTPAPVVRGTLVDSVSYNDNTLREVLNGLADLSGYMFYLDAYYRLAYNPSYYAAAPWSLTDGTADNVLTFNYYEYQRETDGTQRKRRIKIIGGKFKATQTDSFSGNGTTKQFSLTYSPYQLNSLVIGSTTQRVGVYGRDSFSSGHFDVLVNKQNSYILFNNAPASGTNNVVCTYSYEADVVTQVLDQDTSNTPNAPAYVIPSYDAKVNDTNLVSLATANQRGLAEISKYSPPRTIIKLKCNQFAPAGFVIFLTNSLEGYANRPFLIQQVTGVSLGGGVNEFQYELGAYNPTLLDHIRNANKAVNRSVTTSNITVIQQIDLVFEETTAYSETITFTAVPAHQTTYGATTAKYGSGVTYA